MRFGCEGTFRVFSKFECDTNDCRKEHCSDGIEVKMRKRWPMCRYNLLLQRAARISATRTIFLKLTKGPVGIRSWIMIPFGGVGVGGWKCIDVTIISYGKMGNPHKYTFIFYRVKWNVNCFVQVVDCARSQKDQFKVYLLVHSLTQTNSIIYSLKRQIEDKHQQRAFTEREV